jgi:hypothetical protein
MAGRGDICASCSGIAPRQYKRRALSTGIAGHEFVIAALRGRLELECSIAALKGIIDSSNLDIHLHKEARKCAVTSRGAPRVGPF